MQGKFSSISQNAIRDCKAVIGGAFIFSIVALYNGFPLVYSDTGTYISSGFEMFVPMDRPIIYGIFIRLFSLGQSPWSVVFIQNIITSYVLFITIKSIVFDKHRYFIIHLILTFTITVFTGVAWYSNQLMPDFTTALVILIFFIFLRNDQLKPISKLPLSIILIFSITSHLSHLLLGIIFTIISIGYILLKWTSIPSLITKRIIYCNLVICLSWLTLAITNKVIDNEFSISKGSHVFLMAHLNDSGILKQFLCAHCQEEKWADNPMCSFKDSLPNDAGGFIWNGHIIDSCGGWKNSKNSFNSILKASVAEPRFLLMNIEKFMQYGFVQLGQFEVGHGLTSYENSTPQEQFARWFPRDLNNYHNSRQNKWNGISLNFEWINLFQTLLIFFCCLILLLTIFNPLINNNSALNFKMLLALILSGIFFNAVITGGLNSPYGRLQARVIWLLPWSTILLLLNQPQLLKLGIKSIIPGDNTINDGK